MAESFLSSVAEAIAHKIGSVILQEVGLACGAKRELKRLENVLATIKAVLVDAEEKQWTNQQLRDWLGKLKQVCYDAEDVLDEFEFQALQRQVVSHGSIKRKVLGFFSSSNPLPFSFKMGHRIREIRERLDDIAINKNEFNLESDVKRAPIMSEETHSFVLASDVIGRDEDKKNILELLKNSSDEESISVIPIIGIGGLGKTTLAKFVYDDDWVVGHFKNRMWVPVSRDFDLKRVIIDIINSIKIRKERESGIGLLKHGKLSIDESQTILRRILGNENFFLVLDGIWDVNLVKWNELRTLLKNGAKGNKIVITTRISSVASKMGTVEAYNLECLDNDDCLFLFLKWAFKEGEEKKHPNLVDIGADIVKKCNGIPLVARTLGSLLFLKFEERDWLYVRDNEIWKLEQKEGDILPVLRLSYEHLPSYLKCCFAYCSIFPKNYEFNNYHLVQIWSAQGLIQSSGKEQELEDIGNRYIKELISRCFFQDVEDYHSYYKFKMHDLMHDLASSVSKTECTLINNDTRDIPEMVRHVSFCNDLDKEKISGVIDELNNIRTIYFPFKMETSPDKLFIKSCISKFKCIKVLDLCGSDFDKLPSSISDLKHLRYLSLEHNERIRILPKSICELFHLQTLLLQGCRGLEKLPKEFGNLISLRHLEITTKQRALSGISCLESLRFLWIYQCENLEYLLQGTQRLTALRTLYIEDCSSLQSLPPNMKQLPALESLAIHNCERLNSLNGNGKDHIPGLRNLRYLRIGKLPKLEELPGWTRNLKSLDTLRIRECPQLTERCKKITGEDWQKIAHVSNIYIDGLKIESSVDVDVAGLRRIRSMGSLASQIPRKKPVISEDSDATSKLREVKSLDLTRQPSATVEDLKIESYVDVDVAGLRRIRSMGSLDPQIPRKKPVISEDSDATSKLRKVKILDLRRQPTATMKENYF